MGKEINLLERLPVGGKRDWQVRIGKQRPANAALSCQFGYDYFDGSRDTGYGGYSYDGRWLPVAETLINYYQLQSGDSVLDIGCGKGFLVKDLRKLNPELAVGGFDVSGYAIEHAEEEAKPYVWVADTRGIRSYGPQRLIVSINTLHNLPIDKLMAALAAIESVSQFAYIVVDSYRNDEERINLCDWQLTCRAFHDPDEWRYLFAQAGYTGDYSFTFYPSGE